MTTKERINEIFARYNVGFSAEAVVEAGTENLELASVVLEDETVFYSEDEEIAVGSQVTVENADKDMIAVPTGDYTAKDGRVFSIVDGVIESIQEVEAEAEATEVVEVEAEENLPNAVADVLEMTVKALRAEFAELKVELEEVKAEKEAQVTKVEELKASFEAQGLPQAVEIVEEKEVQLSRKDIQALSQMERVAYINNLYTKTK